jgi:hypothetical protein
VVYLGEHLGTTTKGQRALGKGVRTVLRDVEVWQSVHEFVDVWEAEEFIVAEVRGGVHGREVSDTD